MANKDKQILILVMLIVFGFLVLGSLAPQTMAQLNKIGADFNIKFFTKEPSNAAFGVVTLVVEPTSVQNENGAK